jgi:two-component system chemotaxis response regulator CheB
MARNYAGILLRRDSAMAAERRIRLPQAGETNLKRFDPPLNSRSIMVIGASPGGVDALKRVVSNFPADLAAAVFVVLHVGPTSYLPEILDRAGPLPAHKAMNGATFKAGNIYVAPPGFHLLLHDGHMMLRRGPRENLARPAIDPLFRSAVLS